MVVKGLASIGGRREVVGPVVSIGIGLQQVFRHRGGDLVGGTPGGFERPQRVGRPGHPSGLPAPLAILPQRALEVGQRQGHRPLEGLLIDREAAGAGDLQGDERDRLIVAREAVALLGVDDQALLQRRQGLRHRGPDPIGRGIVGLRDPSRVLPGLGGLGPVRHGCRRGAVEMSQSIESGGGDLRVVVLQPPEVRERLQRDEAGVGHPGALEGEFFQVGQSDQVGEARVGDLIAVEREPPQPGEAPHVREPRVGDLQPDQVELLETGQVRQGRQPGIGEIQLDEAERLQVLQRCEVGQPRAGHVARTHEQLLQATHRRDVLEPSIGHPGVVDEEATQALVPSQPGQPGVGDPRLGQVEGPQRGQAAQIAELIVRDARRAQPDLDDRPPGRLFVKPDLAAQAPDQRDDAIPHGIAAGWAGLHIPGGRANERAEDRDEPAQMPPTAREPPSPHPVAHTRASADGDMSRTCISQRYGTLFGRGLQGAMEPFVGHTEADNRYKNSVDPIGSLSEILGISTDCSIHSAGIDIRQTTSAGGFDVLSFSRNIR